MSQPPPPPPPHGENPRTTAGGSGLPPGKYDIFIIPEHSAGSGFLYLPSLKPQWNSFAAGVVSTLAVVIMSNLASPMVVSMFSSPDRMWSLLWVTLVACVGIAAFLLGRHQTEPSGPRNGEGNGPGGQQKPGGGDYGGANSWRYNPPPQNGPSPNQAPPPPPPPPPQHETPRGGGGGPYQSWQEQPRQQPQPEPQPQPQPQPQAQPPPPPPPQSEPEPQPKPQEPKREEPKQEPKPQPKPAPEPKQRPQSPQPTSAKTEAPPKGAWEKAREEIRRREEERKAKEAEAKKKEETARRLRELREREARERERREREARERELKEKLRQEQEAREKERLERELREKIERELREKAEQEAKEREAREREAREREAKLKEEARKREEERAKAEKERQAARERERKEREERAARLRKEQEEKEKNERKGTAYAYSSVGEKTSMWPNGKPPSVAPSQAASTPPPSKPAPSQAAPSPTKPASSPTKSTASASATGTEDIYSYRPYDTPKKPTARKKSVSDFSESSWAPSHSTARTTPPPSTRGPYTTNDPQKIVIKAVYGYLNQFSKTPASQLISGVGPVTDGLILRITSAGLFVDDDVRGVAQREWDIKAWTLKLVEVWCPVHAVTAQAGNTPGSVPTNHPFFKTMPQSARRGAERGATKTMLGEEAVAYIDEFGRTCSGTCRKGLPAGSVKGEGLHLLRATIRDQEGKRYLFVVGEEEAWKIAGGLAALRGSSQVRALGVAGFSSLESKTLLDTLGWGG
ncbi:hypothetical protein C8A03DRAFT_31295 [Achaetomium macrosporum]|uniref:Uncharacterized protein n=1 Tax=Achaetomium macrosporum TaxID=79813 RepID=A0AAN7HG31_9PEZI|nr:hypothetical protein C8A03DRAFT_31295 [Achaetomium macrosporum]